MVGTLLMLPVLVGLGLGAHALLAGAAKGVIASARPVTDDEPTTAHYERRVYRTADAAMLQVAAVAAAAGGLAWLGVALDAGWPWALALLALGAAVALDLNRWERVGTSPTAVWVQRGVRGRPHRIPLEQVLDLRVEEEDVGGFTLRHGTHNRVARLWLRLPDQKALALPVTDADQGLEGVEAVANQIRSRKAQMDSRHDMARAEAEASRRAREAAAAGPSPDAEARLALRRLREKALDPSGGAARPDAPPPSGAR
ncbi:MAG: hypothetical protein MUC74_15515 [Ideonella sp.]|jgi:hypothetical protein|nr:hypothetical protein [Ideonella sp.]